MITRDFPTPAWPSRLRLRQQERRSVHRAADDRRDTGSPPPHQVAAFQRGITVPDMLCDLLSRQLPDDVGGAA